MHIKRNFCSPDTGGASGVAQSAEKNDELFEIVENSAAGSEQIIDGLDAVNATDTEGNPLTPQPVTESEVDDELSKADYDTLMGIIKSKYAKEHQEEIDSHFNKRFKNHKRTEEAYNALKPLIAANAARYGLDPKDVSAVIKAAVEDNSNYEKEAYERGFGDPAAYRKHLAEQQELNNLREEKRIREENEKNERDRKQLVDGWRQESEEFKKLVPDFDLNSEWKNNEEFRYFLTSGMSVKKAYYAAHAEELASSESQKAAKKAEQKVINEVKANLRRPSENGVKAATAVRVKKSVKDMSLADYERVFDEARDGAKISFD